MTSAPRAAHLVLQDGSVFTGVSFGAPVTAAGEVVFNTSMTGYQEMLTDPSYAGQVLVPTYPLMGNYGINDTDAESARIQVKAFVVRGLWHEPSHYDATRTLHDYLASHGIPGVAGVDTRAITRRIRSRGVMQGAVTTGDPMAALGGLARSPDYGATDFVREVSTRRAFEWATGGTTRIAVVDCGVKYNILRCLAALGVRTTVFPCTASAEEILERNPDGIAFSPGPGDPVHLDEVVATAKKLIHTGRPTFGICLGNQIVGKAFGAGTFKLPFGHRGGNHPVKELATDRVYITSQNHGYAVDPRALEHSGLEVSHVNLNDGTVEGLRHRELPVFTIQYHPEANPGPRDNEYLFERFLAAMDAAGAG